MSISNLFCTAASTGTNGNVTMTCYAAATDEYNGVDDYLVSMSIYWSGKDSNGNSISGSKVFNSINKETATYTFTTNCSAKYYFEATMNVASKNSSRSTTCAHNPNSSNTPSDSSSNHDYKVSVTAQEVNGILNIGAWDYGSVPDMSGTFKSFSISWSGYNSNGKAISGSGTPTIKKQSTTYMSADLTTSLDFSYTGSATGTLVTKYGTYTSKTTWGNKTPSEQTGSISITSFYVDNDSTTGMVDGKYVVGTKLCFKANIKSTYKTKTCRYVLTGAKESDNSWELHGGLTANAYSTAVATGIIYVKCIVTDIKGNQAQKELQVKIENEKEDNYYAYYFFGNKFKDSFSKEIYSISITLYNIYNDDAVSEPQGKTIECYAHNFKTFNDIKNRSHDDGALTHITTFVVPDIKNISHATFALTEAEMKTLMKYSGGLAFKIKSPNCLTVHDVKCSIDIVFK